MRMEGSTIDDAERKQLVWYMCREWTEMNSRSEEWNGYFQGDEREEDQQHVAMEGDK